MMPPGYDITTRCITHECVRPHCVRMHPYVCACVRVCVRSVRSLSSILISFGGVIAGDTRMRAIERRSLYDRKEVVCGRRSEAGGGGAGVTERWRDIEPRSPVRLGRESGLLGSEQIHAVPARHAHDPSIRVYRQRTNTFLFGERRIFSRTVCFVDGLSFGSSFCLDPQGCECTRQQWLPL